MYLLPEAGVQMGNSPLGKHVAWPELYPYFPGPFTGEAPVFQFAVKAYAGNIQVLPEPSFGGAEFLA